MSILIENVSKKFGDKTVLDSINLEIKTGSLVALLGGSGSGKSTLLRIVAGFEQPEKGRIWLHGKDSSFLSIQEKEIGFVFQAYALFQHLTVYKNIAFGMSINQFPLQFSFLKNLSGLFRLQKKFIKHFSNVQSNLVTGKKTQRSFFSSRGNLAANLRSAKGLSNFLPFSDPKDTLYSPLPLGRASGNAPLGMGLDLKGQNPDQEQPRGFEKLEKPKNTSFRVTGNSIISTFGARSLDPEGFQRRNPIGLTSNKKTNGRTQSVEELLRVVQLEELAHRYPHQLSGGQCQRVALARALAVQPKVLLLDEPFGALDMKVRKQLRRWLRQLHEKVGVTTIFVTHDYQEAMEVANEIVVLEKGRIKYSLQSPQNIYTRLAVKE